MPNSFSSSYKDTILTPIFIDANLVSFYIVITFSPLGKIMVFSSNVHLFIKNSPKIIYINLSFHCIILSKLKQYFLKVGGYMNKTVLIVED